MNQRHYLLKGTFILTMTGLLTRTAGFFYRIFLSRTIGASEIGRFQLVMPVFAFCAALSCGGIQTAVSRFTAEYYAKKKPEESLRILTCALLLSGGLSACCTAAVFFGAPWIARSFLLEPSCAGLLRMTALSLPFSVIHGCISGFFIGHRNVSLSAKSQFTEQLFRILSVILLYLFLRRGGGRMDASVMVLGQIAGELSAAAFCIFHLCLGREAPLRAVKGSAAAGSRMSENGVDPSLAARPHSILSSLRPGRAELRRMLSVSAPLGLNRMLLCVLQGIEAALLPQMLRQSGCSGPQSLSIYGTFTGMALPLILFPTAVTGALGTLLLPAVSEARALRQDKKITGTVDASFHGSLLLGFFFLGAFLLFGDTIGRLLFHSPLAGIYIRKLALLCPFLYINTTLVSILHGLGATTSVTLWNVAASGIRLAAILRFVPGMGMDGYLAGSLLSHAFTTACSLYVLHRRSGFSAGLSDVLLRPALLCLGGGACVLAARRLLPYLSGSSWMSLLPAFLYAAVFLLQIPRFRFLRDRS